MKKLSSFLPEPLKLAVAGISAWAVLLGSCSQTPVTVNLHSLQASGNVSFVCRGDDNAPTGHKLDECPEYQLNTRRLFALVTQTATNEVAVVDLVADAVVDEDPTTPGYSFLRVGARPGALVTTPGGAATFVGVSGLQKNGVFALPTTCLEAPAQGQVARDLTSWAACSLSSAPGDITVVLDQELGADGKPRTSCPNAPAPVADVTLTGRECPTDLTGESGPPGRRKLLVALPEEHRLVLLDAQALLDRSPGEFAACTEERSYPLSTDIPAPVPPTLPADLQPAQADAQLCPVMSYPPLGSSSSPPILGGFAALGDRVYVADRTLPVVHVLDVADPCTTTELPPLLPQSYLAPERVVTTSRLAVSPLTPKGNQFVYAVDETDQPTASVMAFDVSPNPAGGKQIRTPIVFPGAPRQPYLPPDRLRFSAPVRDVSFVMRDFPVPNAETGVGQFGLTCDPYPTPAGSLPTPGALYRPNSDFSSGAGPLNLRGVFGLAMLTNGQVAVIDVEDFDQPCRRPETTNGSKFVDFRGCSLDPAGPNGQLPAEFVENGVVTVTNESSCNVIEAHRPRDAALSISSSTVGLHAPTLRSFPQFSNPDPAAVITVDKQPRMMAVNFDNPDPSDATPVLAQVNVSTQLYANCPNGVAAGNPPPCDLDSAAQPLVLDPTATAVQNSLTLPLVEPRSYAQDEAPTLTYEGRVFADRTSAFLQLSADPQAVTAVVNDPDANFCGAGVQDSDAISVEGSRLGIAGAKQSTWGDAHADYVQITGDFPGVDDVYWSLGQGQFCSGLLKSGQATALGGDRDACEDEFGNIDNPLVLKETRDLSIDAAYTDHLVVRPRNCGPLGCAATLQQMACCFPAGTAYTVRASRQWLLSAAAGLHDIGTAEGGRCKHTASCDLRKKYFHSRAFEVCNADAPFDKNVDTDGTCTVDNPNVGCVFSGGRGLDANGVPISNYPIQPRGPGSQCIFENLTSRFVVYRGKQPSTRGMAFSWQTTGGFTPLAMSLATQSSAVNPQSMAYLPEVGYLAVVDGSTLGLSLFDLNSLGIVSPSPYF